MNRNLRRILLCAVLTVLPIIHVKAVYDWVPVGDGVNAEGFATTGGTYTSGDYLGENSPYALTHNGAFTAIAGADVLNIYGTLYTNAPSQGGTQVLDGGGNPIPCTLKVNGDLVVDATNTDMTINIMEDVTIEPYFEAPTVGSPAMPEADGAQVYFRTAAGTKISVNVDNWLKFAGKTTETGFRDLLVTFAGRGVTEFMMAEGVKVTFDGQIDTSSPMVLVDKDTHTYEFNDPSAPVSVNAGGTKVFILMDQTIDDVNAGLDKVVFSRKDSRSPLPNSQHVAVEVGPNSVFTYLSTNPTGLPDEAQVGGYGSVGFDISNAGVGRSLVFIRGAYAIDEDPFIPNEGETPNPDYLQIKYKYPFNDGAFIIAGHLVQGFEPGDISGVVLPGEGESTTPGYDFSQSAGIKAIVRVINDKKLAADPTSVLNPDETTRLEGKRGLLFFSDVQTHGKLASDPYWDLYQNPDTKMGVEWAFSNSFSNTLRNVRKGIVIGANGRFDVFHDTFAEFFAGSINSVDPLAEADFGDAATDGNPGLLKKRNPSALIIDNLDTALFINGNPFRANEVQEPEISPFTAANPYAQVTPVHGEIFLRGDAQVYTMAAASSLYGYASQLYAIDPNPFDNMELDWTNGPSLGLSTYDGYQLAPLEETVQSGEGLHTLDCEGQLDVWSFANTTIIDHGTGLARAYATTFANVGVMENACLTRDYTGREVVTNGQLTTLVNRPLLADGSEYSRYNSPGWFFNASANFYNSIIRHSDATKYVDGIPNMSEPAWTGGEELFFMNGSYDATDENNVIPGPDRFRFPELRLYNSNVELFEALNLSGLRMAVKDIPNLPDLTGSNESAIYFFDHGDPLDTKLTGYGRILMFGSSLNLMADDSNNYVTESCRLNVFKGNAPTGVNPLIESSSATLALRNGNQFHPDVQAIINTLPSFAEKQRAHHLMLFAQPDPDFVDANGDFVAQPNDNTPGCNMVIGWSNNTKIQDTIAGLNAPAGDAGIFPGSFPYPGEPLIANTDWFTSNPFSIDALITPPATVSIEGSFICFGSFDKNGKSITIPVATDDNDGVVYVKHGGKLTITRPAGSETTSIPWQGVASTMIAQRLWNDYNADGNERVVQLTGILDLPHDQMVYENGFGVQPYNITKEMFEARRADTFGFVRLPYENTDRTPARDRSGAGEVTIDWFDRELADLSATMEGSAGNILLKSHKSSLDNLAWMTRATESVDTPQQRPTDLLYVGPGDEITQMKVAGATMSDPFFLDIAGDGIRPLAARVREFVSLHSSRNLSTYHFISEGAHAVLFLAYGGRIGLGNRQWNDLSPKAWNLLGKDYVTICPLGEGVIDLNSDVLITDRLPLIASDTFALAEVQRLTFVSEAPREIRIPAGCELDLSSFGQSPFMQQIVFAGNVKLIVEEGATIRFPKTTVGGVVLYFSDSAQLIFEGGKEPSTFLPFTDAKGTIIGPNTAPIANSRTRILGKGQIWLNKNAQIKVNGKSYVGVETDDLTQQTDLTISLQRQSSFFIGDESLAGGAFQVGNPTDQGSNSNINFSLILNGSKSLFHIDREGFFGLGAGIMNKNGVPNGKSAQTNNPVLLADGTAQTILAADGITTVAVFNPDTNPYNGVWEMQALNNLGTVNVTLTQGIFEHKNIVDGTNTLASLLAVGPAVSYTLNLNGLGNFIVRGGGSVAYIPSTATNIAPIYANIWDYSGSLFNGESYAMLASGPLLIDRSNDLAASATVANYNINGKSFTFINLLGGNTAQVGFYNFLACRAFSAQSSKKVDISSTQFGAVAGYVNDISGKYNATTDGEDNIRVPAPSSVNGGGTVADAIALGALGAAATAAGDPTNFAIIQ